MSIAPFPHHYTVRYAGGALVAAPRAAITAGPPSQFGGTDLVWSPEDLLVGATLLCLKTTFDAFARRDHLSIIDWRGSGTGILDRGREGPVFTSIDLSVELLTAPEDEARARVVLELAKHNCIISRALAVPVTLQITTRTERAAS